jgi:prepilin-type N-terminal cleavage/methylation domain-containing protein
MIAIESKIEKQQGFTLVEMLIALVLSSIIFASAYQVISNLVQYRVRANSANMDKQDNLLLTNLLSQIIEKSISQNDLFYRPEKSSVFRGEEDFLQILSRAYSENFDEPGYRVFRIYRRNEELHVGYQKYDQNYRTNAQLEISAGLKLKQIHFGYLEDGQWVRQWRNEKKMPALIRVKIVQNNTRSMHFIRSTGRR